MEENVIILKLDELKKKGTNETLYKVDYVRVTDKGYKVKTDWVEAIEFLNIKKKAKIPAVHTTLETQTGIFGINAYDGIYLKDIK